MKNILVALFTLTVVGCTTVSVPDVTTGLQICPASPTPGPGLREMSPPGTEGVVYVSPDVAMTSADVASARVTQGQFGPQIDIEFTPDGAKRFAALTRRSMMKPLAMLVDGRLISAPVVRDEIAGGRAVLTGNFSADDAERLAKAISPE